jgi:hypothetical protein
MSCTRSCNLDRCSGGKGLIAIFGGQCGRKYFLFLLEVKMRLAASTFVSVALAFAAVSVSCVTRNANGIKSGGLGTDSDRVISVRDIRGHTLKTGVYVIEGFVIRQYVCPPCPPDMGCEPCRRGNSIAISSENKLSTKDGDPVDEVLLVTANPSEFTTGRKYHFVVDISDQILPNDPNQRIVKIVDFSPTGN